MSAPRGQTSILHVVLIGLVVMGMAWMIRFQWIAPLQHREAESLSKLAAAQQRVDDARKTIQEITELESETGKTRAELDQLYRGRGPGSVMLWFPAAMTQHFESFGISNSATRLNTSTDDANLPGYQQTYWAIDLPIGEGAKGIRNVLIAVAALEQSQPIARVIDISVLPGADESSPFAVINVAALVRD